MHDETKRVRGLYDTMAERYDRSMGLCERLLIGGGRSWVCAQAQGATLEVAIGTGRNLPLYPAEVRLTGVELSPAMLEIARTRARTLGRAVDLRVGDAQALEFPDGSFDTVIFTLALCTIPDDRRAVAEAIRVLRRGGRLLWLEHVRSPLWPVRAVERLLDPICVRTEADHLLREPLEHLAGAGVEIAQIARSRWGIIERVAARKTGT